MARKHERRRAAKRCQVTAIDVLPDDVLLDIFHFYVNEARMLQAWQSLVHVCRRWRSLVFDSPNRLNLRLVCTNQTPASLLDVWPALPLLIQGNPYRQYRRYHLDNIIAVLERSDSDCVCQIDLDDVLDWELKTLSAAMQVPFPELTNLKLASYGEVALPDSFLGGSAPRLQELWLDGIPFPGLPKLLLSATHLVKLSLVNIRHSGYISPEAIITPLSTLTSLEQLRLGFDSPRSRPDSANRRPPPPMRSALPALTYFLFKGDNEYLDDLVARIDAPRLSELYITLFNDIIFDTPQFIQFVYRSPMSKALEIARLTFDSGAARVNLSSLTPGYGELHVNISCNELDWQVLSLEQVCTSSLPPLSMLECLYIQEGRRYLLPRCEIENALWLELLHPFRTVKNLYLSKQFALRIGPALQELVGGRVTEVLPSLQNIFLQGFQPSGLVQEGIGKFVAARQVTSHPIAVSRWDRG